MQPETQGAGSGCSLHKTNHGCRVDWKAAGYLISIVSVFLLGAVAWPSASEPAWVKPVLITGMATSVIGMAFRYKAHKDQQREIRRAEAKAGADPGSSPQSA